MVTGLAMYAEFPRFLPKRTYKQADVLPLQRENTHTLDTTPSTCTCRSHMKDLSTFRKYFSIEISKHLPLVQYNVRTVSVNLITYN